MKFFILIYQILFTVGFIFLSPILAYKFIRRHKWKIGLRQRFGYYKISFSEEEKRKKTLWFHAASVGEVGVIVDLVKALRQEFPQWKIIVSTLTSTGQDLAHQKMGDLIHLVYYPLDFIFSVKKALELIRPDVFVLVESEIWPYLLYQLQKQNVPIALINARMSRRSYRRYHFFRFFLRKVIRKMKFITVPNLQVYGRMASLGASDRQLKIVGNLKYDKQDFYFPAEEVTYRIRQQMGYGRDDIIFICGSTHPGEEEALVKIYKDLLKKHSDLKLLLAPRHPERAKQVAGILKEYNMNFRMRSQSLQNMNGEVMILDTLGELERLYAIGDIIFVGKSLKKKGGQNLMEPARFGKPIIFGPHMENFEEMASLFIHERAALQVEDEVNLSKAIEELINIPEKRQLLGTRARYLLSQHGGAYEKTRQLLTQQLIDISAE